MCITHKTSDPLQSIAPIRCSISLQRLEHGFVKGPSIDVKWGHGVSDAPNQLYPYSYVLPAFGNGNTANYIIDDVIVA